MSILYQQKQKSSMMLVFPFLLMTMLFIYLFDRNYSSANLKYLFFCLFLFGFFLTMNFSSLKFNLTNYGLEFGFGFFKKKIPKSQIKSVFIENPDILSYGISKRADLNTYIAKKSEGLLITLKNGLKFFVSLDDPEKAIEKIKQNKYV